MNRMVSMTAAKYDDIFEVFAESYIDNMTCPLIVVDDGLSQELKAKYKNFQYTPAPSPYSWARLANAGIKAAGDADVIVFNDDVFIYTKNMDEILQAAAYASPDIGAASAMRDDRLDRSLAKTPEISNYDLYLLYVEDRWNDALFVGGIPYTTDPAQWGKYANHKVGNTPMTTCTYVKRSVINLVGLLDEGYLVSTEDYDWGLRILEAGYLSALVYGAYIEHGGIYFEKAFSNTRRRAGNAGTAQVDKDYFNEKWGKIRNGTLKLPVREETK